MLKNFNIKILDNNEKSRIFVSTKRNNMKTYFCTYKTAFTEKQFIIAACDEYEAEATAFASEVGTFLDGTKFYPNSSDFHITELIGCTNRQKNTCIIQKLSKC